MNAALAQVLDECLERIRRDGVTIQQCLAAHPQHARELEPLLSIGAGISQAAAPPARAGAHARITAQFERRLLDQPPSLWQRIFPPQARRLAIGAAVAVLVLSVITTGGIGYAAQSAVPGDRLFALRLGTERVEGLLRREQPVDEHTRLSARRLADLRAVVSRADAAHLDDAAHRYEQERAALLAAAAEALPAQAAQARRVAAEQVIALAAIRDSSPAAAQPMSALLTRLSTSDSAALAAVKSTEPARAEQAAPAVAPAAGATGPSGATEQGVRLNALFAQLRQATTDAERIGALTADQAAELRVLLAGAATLTIGGDHAVVATTVGRLGGALASCADRACAPSSSITPVLDAVRGAAMALGLPPPAALAARSSPPIAAPRLANTPAPRAATTPAPAAAPTVQQTPAAAAPPVPPPAMPPPAAVASPITPPAAAPTIAPTAARQAPAAGAAPIPAATSAAAAASPTISVTPAASATPTPSPTATPTPAPTATAVPARTPAPPGSPAPVSGSP